MRDKGPAPRGGVPGTDWKTPLRRELLAKRDGIPEERRDILSSRIAEQVLKLDRVATARNIMAYVSVRGEVRTAELIRRFLAAAKSVSVPVCDRRTGMISAMEIEHFDRDLSPGSYGIPEPCSGRGRRVGAGEIDLFIVPGVGFDPYGVRLGWGKGYYDSFLAGASTAAVKIGLAYEAQMLPRMASSANDSLMDMVVTEDRVIDCRKIREEMENPKSNLDYA